jgi:hypothetical protein
MEQRREEKELRMLDLESTAPLADATLAKDEDLISPSQRIHNDGPFFERDPHYGILGRDATLGNPRENPLPT